MLGLLETGVKHGEAIVFMTSFPGMHVSFQFWYYGRTFAPPPVAFVATFVFERPTEAVVRRFKHSCSVVALITIQLAYETKSVWKRLTLTIAIIQGLRVKIPRTDGYSATFPFFHFAPAMQASAGALPSQGGLSPLAVRSTGVSGFVRNFVPL